MTLMHALIDKSELLLQGTDFVSNLLYRLIACFNLYGVQRLIHNVSPDHCLCFFRYLKRGSIPAPITVKENAVSQGLLSLLAHRRFTDAHCSADLNITFSCILRQISLFCFSAILLKPSRSLILHRSAVCPAGFFPGIFPRSECRINTCYPESYRPG